MTEKPGKVVFCISNNHYVMPDQFFWSYHRMMKPNGSIAVKGSASIKATSINDCIYQAMSMNAEWMFLMDVDQTFPPPTIPRLLVSAKKYDAKILSVLYHLGKPPYAPVAGWIKQTKEGYDYVNSEGKHWRDHYAPIGKGVVEVDWAGSGGLLIHRDVINSLEWPPFLDEWRDGLGVRSLGHDISFCKRARLKGFKIYVDTAIQSAHGKFFYVDTAWAETFNQSNMPAIAKDVALERALEPDYWDTIWQEEHIRNYDRGTAKIYKTTNESIIDLIPEGAKVVDVGCGAGGLLRMIQEQRKADCFGIDFSPQAIDLLKAKGMQGEVADLRTFEPNGHSGLFDVVISTHTLEHLVDDTRLIKIMKQLGKPGALLVLATPSAKGVQEHFEHVRGYDENDLKTMLENEDLQDVVVNKNPRDFVVVGKVREAV